MRMLLIPENELLELFQKKAELCMMAYYNNEDETAEANGKAIKNAPNPPIEHLHFVDSSDKNARLQELIKKYS